MRPPFTRFGLPLFEAEPAYGDILDRSLLGTAAPLQGAAQVTLAEVNLPQGRAASWVVTLRGLRYSSGTITTGFGQLDGDHQVDSGNCKITVQWGVAGAQEEALVDYPWAGSTFTIHAATVRVLGPRDLIRQNAITTFYAAFIAPNTSRDASNAMATFTPQTQPAAPGTDTLFPIPYRARRYIPYCIDAAAPDANNVNIEQFWNVPANVMKQDVENTSVGILGSPQVVPEQGFQLHPRATGINIRNVGAAGRNVGAIFMLDLG